MKAAASLGALLLGGCLEFSIPKYVTSCSDKLKNGSETDVDCGGTCAPCATGLRCRAAADCADKFCASNGVCAVEQFTVSGTVSGLAGTLVMQDNGADNLSITENGPFSFSLPLAANTAYAVTVLTQPSGQRCSIAAGSGSISADVTNVTVSCIPTSFALSVEVTGVGFGTVTSDSGGIDCTNTGTGTCSATYAAGTLVTLTATEDSGYVFAGWTGAGCPHVGPCVVTLDQTQSVRATFIMIAFHSTRGLGGGETDAASDADNIWVIDSDGNGLRHLTDLTAASLSVRSLEWSPDGTQIAFTWNADIFGSDAPNANGTYNVWVVAADGSSPAKNLTNLTASGTDTAFPKWSPDGSQIAFASAQDVNGSNSAGVVSNIWVIGADGKQLTPLTTVTSGADGSGEPVWSPDGTRIAYSTIVNGVANIWVMNADGGQPASLTEATAAAAHCVEPQWSADGSKLLFLSYRSIVGPPYSDSDPAGAQTNIWVVNADHSGLSPVTTFSGVSCNLPVWSPDQSTIVFSSPKDPLSDAPNANNISNIWTIAPNGSGLTALTNKTSVGEGSDEPQWSPNGSQIVFASQAPWLLGTNGNHTYNLWTVDVGNTALSAITKVTAASADSRAPRWAP